MTAQEPEKKTQKVDEETALTGNFKWKGKHNLVEGIRTQELPVRTSTNHLAAQQIS